LESIVQKFEIRPQNTYNLDKVGFLLGLGQSERVLEVIRNPRENGELKYYGTHEFVTVIQGVCVDGTTLKPTIILKAEEFIVEWFKKVQGIPENILFGRSHNGWTDEKMAMKYLGRNFGNESITAQKAKNEYRLLLFDGHSSHVNMKFLDFCISQKIIPYCLLPHTTHRLQPLDVCIFSPYKDQYQKELTRRFEGHEYGMSKESFYEILMIARRASFTPSIIQSGFGNTGLVPINRNIVLLKIQALP
ncbi:CENP-B protein, partial [Choiromyces venosus 120613-1]